MKNIKLTIEYDGTSYHGWQRQNNAVTIQDTIEACIAKITGEECSLTGASRTDQGVHALGQVANFKTRSPIPVEKFPFVLNSVLPDDICIKKAELVDDSFHSRYDAKGKKYRYLIYNSPYPSALLRNRAYHVPAKLDIENMNKAAHLLLGTHDFTAFKAAGGSAKTSERTITDVSLTKNEEIITFEIKGNGFLYNMVRIIVGTLIYVGLGKIDPDDVATIINSKERRNAGKTVGPQGLYLVEVYY